MSNENEVVVLDLLTKGKSVSAIVSYLVTGDLISNKEEAKAYVLEVAEDNGISTKKVTKADELKKWFLAHDEPSKVTMANVKAECERLEMKGGSVQYYVNSYKLAIDLYSKISN